MSLVQWQTWARPGQRFLDGYTGRALDPHLYDDPLVRRFVALALALAAAKANPSLVHAIERPARAAAARHLAIRFCFSYRATGGGA
jgi:hypothetical protein